MEWLKETQPDVVCLQETKVVDAAFPAGALLDVGYRSVWTGEATWNGVAILARATDPIVTRRTLPGDPADRQRRYIEAAVNGVLISSIYLPNGNPQPGPKFAYKLAWFERLITHAKTLNESDLPVVLAGDYNVVPTELDIYASKSWRKNALLQPASRRAYQRLLDQGWADAIRVMHPTAPIYTFWDFKWDRWLRNAGLRLDHLLLSEKIAHRLVGAGVDSNIRGVEGASDHAPAWIELR